MKRVMSLICVLAFSGISVRGELVHHWTMDETDTSMGATITDVVGGLNGTVNGAAVTSEAGFEGGALHFTGDEGEYVGIPGFSTAGLSDITVAFWMNMDVGTIASLVNGSYQRLVSAADNFEAIIQSDASADTGKVANNYYAAGGKANYTMSTNVIAEGEWVHIAMTASLSPPGDGRLTVYVNGEFSNDGPGTANDPFAGGELRFAHRGSGAGANNHFSGLLDDIRIYDTILSDEEIQALVPQPSVSVTGFEKAGDELVITWDSDVGTGYNVFTSDDLTVAPPGGLVLLDPHTNLAGIAGSMSVTTMVDAAAADKVYGVERFTIVLPPIFVEDFESGAPGWTTSNVVGFTNWELGTPNYTGANGAFTTASSGTNAWGTGLTAAYAANDHVILRSPVIDLAGLPRAKLTFFDVKDIEQENATSGYDHGYVNILDAAGATLATRLYDGFGTTTNWTRRVVNLDAFIDQQIIIEFQFLADSLGFTAQFGWALDDVTVGADAVTVPPPPPPDPIDAQISAIVMVKTQPSPSDIFTISDGSVIDLDTLGVAASNVNIRAETDIAVGSVRLNLNAGEMNQIESVAPYYLGGDAAGIANDLTLPAGTHTLVVTPYELAAGGGGTGVVRTVTFTVIATP